MKETGHAAGVGAIVQGLEQAADAVPGLHRQIHEAEELGRKHKAADLANKWNKAMNGDRRYLPKLKSLTTQMSETHHKIEPLDKIAETMKLKDRTLMLLDGSNSRMEAAIGIGDIDKADNVATLTPGINTTVDGKLREYDGDMKGLRDASNRISKLHGNHETTAAVTWIGHSYGSTVNGYSLGEHGTSVDDAVQLGSPGMGAYHSEVPSDHLYSKWNKGDYVPYTQGGGTLGPNTYASTDVLSNRAHTDPDGHLRETTGHGLTDGYLAEKSSSQHNLAAVITDNKQLAHHSTADDFARDRLGE